MARARSLTEFQRAFPDEASCAGFLFEPGCPLGPPKSGKSFWIFDVGMHIALGWEYRGRRVQQGIVVYIAREGEHCLRARKEAFLIAKLDATDVDPPFYLLTTQLNLVADADVLIADISAEIGLDQNCAAIIIDTLNRSIDGSESSDEDMTACITARQRACGKPSTVPSSLFTIAASTVGAPADIPHYLAPPMPKSPSSEMPKRTSSLLWN